MHTMKTSYAHGGMTAHGLKVGDKIAGSQKNEVVGLNEEEQEIFITDLDKGKRESKRYNKGDKAQLESARQRKRKYAQGGATKERGALSKREKDFIKEELKNGKGQGFSYKAKILHGQEVVIRSKNGTPIKKWAFDNFKIALKIAMKLNKESNIQDGYMAKGGKTNNWIDNYLNSVALSEISEKGYSWNDDEIYDYLYEFRKSMKDIPYEEITEELIENGIIEKNKMAKGGKTKKGKKEPMVVRSYFEDEAIDYGSGGAIYKGDKVKIKDTNKSMVVKNIAKGKKGYVEFTGDKGTYLKGDLEKFAQGGEIGKELMGGQPFSEPKPSGAILLEVRRNGREIIVTEDGGKTKERYVKSNGFAGYTLRYKGNQYEFTDTLMEDGGEVGSDNYKVVKVFRKSGRKVVLEKWLTREEAMRVVARYPNSNTSMVIFTKMFEEGGMTSGWCYSIGGL